MSKRGIKLGIAMVLLVGLCVYTGIDKLWEVITRIEPIYLVALVFLSFILIAISCIKWQLFVREAGHEESLLQLMKFYTMSYFFNLFLPSILGGDVARSVQLGSRIGSYADAFATTFVERFTGFLAMNVVGVVFVLAGAKATENVEIAVLSVGFITMSAALILFSERASRWCGRVAVTAVRAVGLRGAAAKLESVVHTAIAGMAFARRNDRLFLLAMFYSLLFHFFAVVNTYVAALCIGWDTASFASLCVVVPLVLLVAVAPITPSAVGVQEGAFLYFLTRIGATQAEALGVGLVLRAKNLLTALVGGLIWVLTKEREKSNGRAIPERATR